MLHELERLTVLFEERWQALLGELDLEVARRMVAVKAEAARLASNSAMDEAQRQQALLGRWGGGRGQVAVHAACTMQGCLLVDVRDCCGCARDQDAGQAASGCTGGGPHTGSTI